jgi:hypothetical protein
MMPIISARGQAALRPARTAAASPSARPALLLRQPQPQQSLGRRRCRRRRAVLSRAQNDQDNNTPNDNTPSKANNAKFDLMLAQLRATGLNQEKARRLLKAWAKAGAMDPEQLKQLLARRSVAPARALALQAALDLGAGIFGFFTGSTIGQASEFPGQIFLQLACYFGAMWYSISAVAGGSALAQVVLAARRYSASADVLLAAVRQIAGPQGVAAAAAEAASSSPAPGALAANVALAVSTAKVVAALDAIAEQLKAMDPAGSSSSSSPPPPGADSPAAIPRSTLVSLAAYLTVKDAQDRGFVAADFGLSEKEATDIAAVFALYDSNENFVLEREELGRMVEQLGRGDLLRSDAEIDEAMRLMSATSAGGGAGARQPPPGPQPLLAGPRGVTFPQFVAWWTGKAGGGGAKGA